MWPQEPQKECDVSALTATHCVFLLFGLLGCLFLCLFACLLACLLVCLFVCLLGCLVAWLLVCVFACLFVCLFVCFFLWGVCATARMDLDVFNRFSKNAYPDVSMRKLADSPCGTDSASKSRLFCQQFCSVLFDTYCSLKPNSF